MYWSGRLCYDVPWNRPRDGGRVHANRSKQTRTHVSTRLQEDGYAKHLRYVSHHLRKLGTTCVYFPKSYWHCLHWHVYCAHSYLNGLDNYTLLSVSIHTYWINRARARTQTRVTQSVKQLATSWTVRGSKPGGGEIILARPEQPWCPASFLYNGKRVFLPEGKAGRSWR